MTEQEVVSIIKKEIAAETLDMDVEGAWDSLDLVTILQALDEATNNKLTEVNDKELGTAKTPRQLIDILKKHGICS